MGWRPHLCIWLGPFPFRCRLAELGLKAKAKCHVIPCGPPKKTQPGRTQPYASDLARF
jgi:hypothetical protein